jgi:hypothetical protein
MKKRILLIASVSTFFGTVLAEQEKSSGRELIDQLVAIVYHEEGEVPLFLSDLKTGIDGVPRTIESEIDKHLFLADAKKLKIEVTQENVDSYLAQVQKENGFSRQDLEEMFEELGYSLESGREYLRQNQTVDMILNFKIKQQLIVDKQEVDSYYAAQAGEKSVLYTVRFGSAQKKASLGSLQDQINTILAEPNESIMWDDSLTIEESALAQDKLFIKDLLLNQPVFFDEEARLLNFIELQERKEQESTMSEEEFARIEALLKKEKYETALAKYKAELRSRASIKYLA